MSSIIVYYVIGKPLETSFMSIDGGYDAFSVMVDQISTPESAVRQVELWYKPSVSYSFPEGHPHPRDVLLGICNREDDVFDSAILSQFKTKYAQVRQEHAVLSTTLDGFTTYAKYDNYDAAVSQYMWVLASPMGYKNVRLILPCFGCRASTTGCEDYVNKYIAV